MHNFFLYLLSNWAPFPSTHLQLTVLKHFVSIKKNQFTLFKPPQMLMVFFQKKKLIIIFFSEKRSEKNVFSMQHLK
jgi:hypothetical protein